MRPAGFRPFTFDRASDVSQARARFSPSRCRDCSKLRTTKILFALERVSAGVIPRRIWEHLIATMRCLGMSEKPIERYQLHLAPAVLANVDGWRGKQPEPLDRDEAIGRLVELGLSASASTRSHHPRIRVAKIRGKAADMAGEAIDRHTDLSATSEEQESRKRQLLNGPQEFRDLRRDHPSDKH